MAPGLEIVEGQGALTVKIHTVQDISARFLAVEPGGVFLEHPAFGRLELLTGPEDPRLRRSGVERFFPFDPAVAAEALADLDGISPDLEVEVFILPTPPADIQSSFAQRNFIFLAPGFGAVPASSVANIVTHELGHVLTWAYVDFFPGRWDSYLALRGLPALASGPQVPHAERSREILAEDIRALFGGPLATASGSIENHDLVHPDQVPGLRDLLAGFFQGPPLLTAGTAVSRAVPNPCNPLTTVQLDVPMGGDPGFAGEVILTLYDLRGRQIKRIFGGSSSLGRVSVEWDGRDESGNPVASGQYLYRISLGGLHGRGKILLVR